MKRNRAYGMVLVAVVLIAATFAAPCYSAYVWTGNPNYRFFYDYQSQFTYITRVAPYLNESVWSAYRVLGNRGWAGRIDIHLYSKNDGWGGYANLGSNALWLNTYSWSSYTTGASIGSTIAHETSHILFGHHVKGSLWANKTKDMWYYYSFLTESLAYYTGSVAYAYGPKYSAATIKSYLKARAGQTHQIISWWGTGKIYNNRNSYSSTLFNQAWWQFHAQGWFLTGNNKLGNPQLGKLLDTLRTYASYSGYYLQSASFTTARAYFEYSFKVSYGYYANAAWTYGNYSNTGYLYGKFYYQWYI